MTAEPIGSWGAQILRRALAQGGQADDAKACYPFHSSEMASERPVFTLIPGTESRTRSKPDPALPW